MFKRWLKRLSEKKGSAMVMVIVAIVILSTLGLAILSLSVTNFRMSLVDKKTTLSFYMAESGLEQAYEIILNHVKAAVIEGNKVVNEKIEEFIQAERNRMISESGYDSEYIVGSDPAGPIDVEKLKDKLKTPTDPEYVVWLENFQNKYKEYLSSTLVDALDDPSNYKVIDESVSLEKPDVKVVNNTTPFFTGNNTRELKLTSTYNKEEYLDGKTVVEKVEMNFNIKVPDKIPDTIQTSTETITVPDNPIFENAFTTPKLNLVFEGSTSDAPSPNVTINGNCYAYGAMRTVNDLRTYGGFTLNRWNNKVTVNGNISAYHVVQHKGNSRKNDNSDDTSSISHHGRLQVNGNVYSEHLLINDDADDCSTTVNGNVYTSDDLLMYGTNSHLNINGDWYGTTVASEKDTSSSEDYPAVSTLTVSGNEYDYTHSLEINKFTEMKRKQFSDINNYLIDVGEVIPEEAYLYGESESEGAVITDEVILINNDINKRVYLLGPEAHDMVITPASDAQKAIKIKVGSDPIKGIIIAGYNIQIYGTVNFNGLILAKENCIHFKWKYPQVFTADRNYLLQKSYELEKIGKNPFKYTRPTGDSLPWPAEKNVVISGGSGNIGVADSLNMDPYKDLISVSDWKKL